ncbi:hypothetical protein [Psychrobacillus sp. FSL K6-1464]|uniref:hypothetical protein n=1 Tax=Psychrobacillus sp. FSL K6-1464 TaxID=2921545 RepID=UPI0030F87588
MYNIFEGLLELVKFTGYSILALWLFLYIKMNGLTEGKDINEYVQNFYNMLDNNILEFTFAVAILEVFNALKNVFIKPFFTESSLKQDLKIQQLEYKIEQLENALYFRQDK